MFEISKIDCKACRCIFQCIFSVSDLLSRLLRRSTWRLLRSFPATKTTGHGQNDFQIVGGPVLSLPQQNISTDRSLNTCLKASIFIEPDDAAAIFHVQRAISALLRLMRPIQTMPPR